MSTLTVYPDPHPETDTVDGTVGRIGVNELWATIRAGAGNYVSDAFGTETIEIDASTTTNQWSTLFRIISLFNTSALGSTATISAAILSFYGSVKYDQLAITPNIDIYTSAPASNTSLAVSDFQGMGAVSQTGSPITYANWSTSGYNNFTFNATGRGNVSKTGISKFGCRNANYDVSGTTPPSWSSEAFSMLSAYAAETANTTYDPKLVVTYTVPLSISVTGIPSAEVVGTSQINLSITATGITTLEALGASQLNLNIAATGISTLEALGTSQLNFVLGLFPSSIDSLETFGTIIVVPGSVTIQPSGIVTLEIFGVPYIGFQLIQVSSIPSEELFGGAVVLPGAVSISPNGIISGEVIGSQIIIPGEVTLLPSSLTSLEAFGTTRVGLILNIILISIPSGEAFGTLYIVPVIKGSNIRVAAS